MDESYKDIERLENAAAFFMICSWIVLLLFLGAGALLLFGGRGAVVSIGGVPVFGIGGIISAAITGVFAVVALRSISHWLNATADILDLQLKNAAKLDAQDKMLKSIGRLLQEQQRDKLGQ